MILSDLVVVAPNVSKTHAAFPKYVCLNRHANCVTSVYLKCLPQVRTAEIRKIIIDLTDDAAAARKREVRYMIDVVAFPWRFSFVDYWQSDDDGKKRMILDVLHQALMWFAKQKGWDIEPFKQAYAEALRRNLVNEGFLRKGKKDAWTSPDRKHKAKLFYSFGLEGIELYAVVFDQKGTEVGRKLLDTLWAHDHYLWRAFGKCSWISNTRFVLKSRDGKKTRSCSLRTLSPSIAQKKESDAESPR